MTLPPWPLTWITQRKRLVSYQFIFMSWSKSQSHSRVLDVDALTTLVLLTSWQHSTVKVTRFTSSTDLKPVPEDDDIPKQDMEEVTLPQSKPKEIDRLSNSEPKKDKETIDFNGEEIKNKVTHMSAHQLDEFNTVPDEELKEHE